MDLIFFINNIFFQIFNINLTKNSMNFFLKKNFKIQTFFQKKI